MTGDFEGLAEHEVTCSSMCIVKGTKARPVEPPPAWEHSHLPFRSQRLDKHNNLVVPSEAPSLRSR